MSDSSSSGAKWPDALEFLPNLDILIDFIKVRQTVRSRVLPEAQ